jgi:hypothetical protein
MKITLRFITEVVAASVIGALLATQAIAGCLDVPGLKIPSAHPGMSKSESPLGTARFVKTGFVKVWEEDLQVAPIVGLWHFEYTSKGNLAALGIPDGAPIDAGVTIWFADGNEMTYSGVRNPIVGATCLGVWKQTGEHTYVLNHIGLSWDPLATSISPPNAPAPAGNGNPGGGPGAPGGPAFIKQYIWLDPDNKVYYGSFSINQLMPDGKTPATPAPIKGTIKATRISIDTDTFEP